MTRVKVRRTDTGWWAVYTTESPATALHFPTWTAALTWANRIARRSAS